MIGSLSSSPSERSLDLGGLSIDEGVSPVLLLTECSPDWLGSPSNAVGVPCNGGAMRVGLESDFASVTFRACASVLWWKGVWGKRLMPILVNRQGIRLPILAKRREGLLPILAKRRGHHLPILVKQLDGERRWCGLCRFAEAQRFCRQSRHAYREGVGRGRGWRR